MQSYFATFLGRKKITQPTPRQIAHIMPPTPMVIPRPVIIHTGTRPAKASFQHISAASAEEAAFNCTTACWAKSLVVLFFGMRPICFFASE